ncbi:SMI1/KNR4 family protein [Streptomyces solicathayae]|uniref:SMI1/KNR4 family protein n=1 Tax=Streptomyces solicathayae TaxID=3081768 RepID=A0ABZ0M4A1_9ACTN|nr:SMI1/KNR4 family protein [Streptomyces sp. HUAS YS2]WOX26315.1 SMI1/KNR4 family protein [Streptomyces sp. HUAS YS2]
MVGDFDAAVAMQDGISDRSEAWDFIRAFAAGWHTPLTAGDGVGEEDLRQIEGRLGLSLPTALREAYLLFGRRPELFDQQDPMLPPSGLFVHEDLGGVLCFRSENQGCAFWGVRLSDLGEADPPVVVQARGGWQPFMDKVSLACVELILSETLFGDGPLYNACELPAEVVSEIPQLFHRVALPDYPMWTGDDESPVRWFSAPGLLLRQDGLMAESWLHVRGRTLAHLSSACSTVPGRWAQWQGTEPTLVDELPF